MNQSTPSSGSGFRKVDSHVHVISSKKPLIPILDQAQIDAMLNISYSGFRTPPELTAFEQALRTDTDTDPKRFYYITSFSITDLNKPGFVESTLAKLELDVTHHGALGVKIWKDLGMMLQDDNGAYVYCDDPRLYPVYDWIAARNLVIYTHIADPLAGWMPLNRFSPHQEYFRHHPEFHWYGQPEKPSHSTLLRHRDALVERYPATPFVAAHLASLEHDLDILAAFLDSHPNASIDTAARLKDLMTFPVAEVRSFFIQYQDRILYGTDWECCEPDTENGIFVEDQTAYFQFGFTYFEETLQLPEPVLRKFYYDNAAALFGLPR